jgi:hypothetical protein
MGWLGQCVRQPMDGHTSQRASAWDGRWSLRVMMHSHLATAAHGQRIEGGGSPQPTPGDCGLLGLDFRLRPWRPCITLVTSRFRVNMYRLWKACHFRRQTPPVGWLRPIVSVPMDGHETRASHASGWSRRAASPPSGGSRAAAMVMHSHLSAPSAPHRV